MKSDVLTIRERPVMVQHLEMTNIYAGILEGYPNARMNMRFIEQTMARAREVLANCEPVLVPPTVEKHEPHPGSSYKPESIPQISCIAVLHSFAPARNKEMDASDLVVVWFQDEVCFPPPASVRALLSNIDWDTCARDYEY